MSRRQGRAYQPEQKKDVLLRLLRVWMSGDNQYLRLGQLFSHVFEEVEVNKETGEVKHLMCVAQIEDYPMIEEIEEHFKEKGTN